MVAFTGLGGYRAKFVGFNTKVCCSLVGLPASLAALALSCLFAMGADAQSLPPNPMPASGGPQNIFYGAIPPDGAQAPVVVYVHGLKGIAADWWLNAVDGSTNPMYDMAYAAGYRTAFVCLDSTCHRNGTQTWLQNAAVLQQELVTIANHYGINNSGALGASYNTARSRMYI